MANTNVVRSRQLDNLLDKTRPRHEPEVEEASDPLTREHRPAIYTPMLDVVLKDGRIRSFNYAYLKEVDFEPGDRMTLRFVDGMEIVAEGSNLRHRRDQIRLHRAPEIRECSESEAALGAGGISQVEAITITEGENK